ncbi:MAG: hypothetical protein WC496_10450 [Phycisphaerae bacterium]|jgi:hypothetical protein
MDNKAVLEELLELLEGNGVKIRKDSLGGGGSGLCKIKDGSFFFADADSSDYEVAAICAKAVSEVLDIETIYLKPEVRAFIEQNMEKKQQ